LTNSLLAARLGSQTPRVANYPPYPLSAAPEVIDFAEHCGLHLDPWQQYVLTHGLGMRADESWTAPKVSCWVPRQNGKGAIIEALELAWLFLPGLEVELVVHSAHQHRTSLKAYGRLERMIRRKPDIYRRVRQFRQTTGEQGVELRDGRRLDYTTRSATAVRGFSAPRLVLDEAQELTADQIAAIMPTVSAMDNWQAWFFGTPPDDPSAWAYGLREDGEAGAPRLAHFDWGLGVVDLNKFDIQAKVASLDTAYECNPALGIRIQIETVEDEQKPSGLGSKYAQERLGAWQPRQQTAGVIDIAQWARLADAGSKRDGGISIGVDISTLRDWAAITVYGTRADGLGHGQLVDYRPGTEWLVAKLAELKKALDPVAVGMGRGTYESLKEDLTAAGMVIPDDLEFPKRGDLAVTNAATMSAACAQIIDAIRQESLRVVPATQLDEAVAGAKARATGETIAWARKDSAADISPLGALTVARWAHLSRIDLIDRLAEPEPWVIFA